jgi:hypothetical protein
MYGRVVKPKAARRDDHDAIKYGPVAENIRSLVDQQEEAEERAAEKAKKAAKKSAKEHANMNAAGDVDTSLLANPAPPSASSSLSSGMSSGATLFVLATIATLGAVVYRVAKRHHYESLDTI